MGGSGFAIDMIRKVKANRALRKQKINRYRSNIYRSKTKLRSEHKYESRSFKTYTDAERRALKKSLRKEKIKAAIIGWTATVFITTILLLLVYLLFR